MTATFVSRWTCTGTKALVPVPSPNCPEVLSPQAHAVPSAFTAKEWKLPAATLVNPAALRIAAGRLTAGPLEPRPSAPVLLSPQAKAL